MANQPTSFRFPFDLPDDVPHGVRNALRVTYNGVKDLNDAIRALNNKANANTSSIETITNNIAASASIAPPPSPASNIGQVNLQPGLTPGAYTLSQSDLGGLIVVQSGIPFALTLNSGLMTPFFTTVYSLGTATVTMTPSLGLVNGVASLPVTQGELAIIYFGSDGNWYVAYPVMPQTSVAVVSNWLNSYNALTGVFTKQQPRAADLVDSTTGGGPVVLDSGATQINQTFTGITKILNLGIFANNAAAIAGGIPVGGLYRNGANPDGVFIVH